MKLFPRVLEHLVRGVLGWLLQDVDLKEVQNFYDLVFVDNINNQKVGTPPVLNFYGTLERGVGLLGHVATHGTTEGVSAPQPENQYRVPYEV